jgi:hypothetical protein
MVRLHANPPPHVGGYGFGVMLGLAPHRGLAAQFVFHGFYASTGFGGCATQFTF